MRILDRNNDLNLQKTLYPSTTVAMKPILFVLIVFLSVCSRNLSAQEIPVTKKSLNNLFKKSIPEDAHFCSGISMHTWSFCVADSSISASDTIRIQNYDVLLSKNCWRYTIWKFCKRHSFKKYECGYNGYSSWSEINNPDFVYHIKLKKITIKSI